MEKITYRVVTVDDTEKVRPLLIENYIKDEPLSKSLKLPAENELLDIMLKVLPLGFSTLAENEAGEIIGVRLSYPRPEIKERTTSDNEVLKFMYFVAEKTKPILKELLLEKCMQSMGLCVKAEYRGKGVGSRLYTENMKLAKSFGYTGYVCDCTSVFSAKICESFNMIKLYEIEYQDYVGQDGKPIFTPEPPHHSLKDFVLKL